jgi:glutamate synthase domain-containing protein 2
MSSRATADLQAAARRFSLFTLVLLLSLLSLLLGIGLAKGWLWLLVLLLPLLALGLWDLIQPAHSLMRNYPLLAHFRWMFEELRPYLRQYIVEDDHSGKPYSHDERALIYARAKGQEDRQPFGTELDAYSGAFEWMTHSIAPKPVVKEPFHIKVGGPGCKRPYEAAILNISAMSFGSLGPHAIEALNWGAKLGGFYHDTGEGGISRYHRIHGGDIVYELGTGYFGSRNPNGSFSPERFADQAQNDQIRMIEIKLSQGAKPGHGGILPGAKVSPEISEARGVAVGVDCISPSRHSAFSTPVEMMEFIAKLRELSGGKPIGFKLCIGHPTEVFALIKAMLKTGIKPDFIVVDGKEGGTGAAPAELSDHLGMPLREGLLLMRNALVGANLRGEIRLAASGKIVSGFSMAANLALGADWCNAARAFMFALGCVQSMRCHTNRCPTGVTTNDPVLQRGLVVALKAQRVAGFQHNTVEALAELVAAAGLLHPQDLMPRHIWHRLNPIEVRTLDRIYNFLEPGVLVSAPDMTPYAEEWRAADADSFDPRIDVGPQREGESAA